jgi:hypothetical protein
MGIFVSRSRTFVHGMRGFYDDRAQGYSVGIVDSGVVNGDAIESGRAEGLDFRIEFFKLASDRFLTLIDAKEDLRGRPCR